MSFKRSIFLFTQKPRYTSEDCVVVIKAFHRKYGRVPTQREIESLSKQGKSPNWTVFYNKGGLNFLIGKAGLSVVNKRGFFPEPGEIAKKFRSFVSNFRTTHFRFPTPDESRRKFGINASTFKNQVGFTYTEALLNLGAPAKRGKQANLPATPEWRSNRRRS